MSQFDLSREPHLQSSKRWFSGGSPYRLIERKKRYDSIAFIYWTVELAMPLEPAGKVSSIPS